MESHEGVILEFAKKLMLVVRDEAVADCDRLAGGLTKGSMGARWTQAINKLSAKDAVDLVVPDVVDLVLFRLMDAIDNDHLPLAWQRQDGRCVSLAAAGRGEMAGWVTAGKGGWIERFSKQRFFDYLADLP